MLNVDVEKIKKHILSLLLFYEVASHKRVRVLEEGGEFYTYLTLNIREADLGISIAMRIIDKLSIRSIVYYSTESANYHLLKSLSEILDVEEQTFIRLAKLIGMRVGIRFGEFFGPYFSNHISLHYSGIHSFNANNIVEMCVEWITIVAIMKNKLKRVIDTFSPLYNGSMELILSLNSIFDNLRKLYENVIRHYDRFENFIFIRKSILFKDWISTNMLMSEVIIRRKTENGEKKTNIYLDFYVAKPDGNKVQGKVGIQIFFRR